MWIFFSHTVASQPLLFLFLTDIYTSQWSMCVIVPLLLQMLDYNVPGGKLNRGLSVVDSLKLLKEGGELTDDEVFQSCALGWCIEWVWLDNYSCSCSFSAPH